nr:retrovirus-related Pol polyprotein from transposon TNT 1-94 [Tanacetum cinerariifolium]
NDHVAKIMGYGDYKIGNVTISRVYFVEGLGHNLFSVGQFCDSDLEVAFHQHTCLILNLDGVDLLIGSRGNNLYTLSLKDMMTSSPICLLSKALKTKSWLWHRRLSHLNFGAINHLARQGLVRGLPKLKFKKDHLCSTCAMGKSKKKSHKPKSEDTNQEKLYLLHMDLCGIMHVESVNGKKYILVIVDDYSRFTCVKCLRSKDEASDFIIKFLKMIQVKLKVGISYETSVARSPHQNGAIERRNCTLIEATHTMNDHVAKIMGYGDYKIGNVTISRVYFVEGLGHNLFSVGQFCDSDLEVAFHQHTCLILNLDGVDLLIGSRGNNLYTLSLKDMMTSSPICLLSKALKTKSWLWHRRLSHLN